jgi:uncharacterized membrane-anchored protein YhcB (DUF1043 family)
MQALDFNFIVLPLGVVIGILVITILFVDSKKEIIRDKRIQRAIEKFKQEKAQKQQEFYNEQTELNRLYETKAIDSETYKRLSTLLQMNAQKLEETMNVLVYAENLKQPKPAKTQPKIKSTLL